MAANPYRGEVEIKMGGEDFILRFDWNALARLREKYGQKYEEKVNQAFHVLAVADLAEIAAIGLAGHHEGITPDKVMELSPPVLPFYRALQEAFLLSLLGPEDDGAADDDAEENEPGKKTARKEKRPGNNGKASAAP